MRIPLVTILLAVLTAAAYPQRCGDSLLLFLRDRDGRVIAPVEFESVKVSAVYTVEKAINLVDAEPHIKELAPRIKCFSVRAECGMKWAQFRLKYKGEQMTIRVLNVPGDTLHILMEGIRFRSGTYTVDLGNRPLKNAEPYAGAGSRAEDRADEIGWVIRDQSLKRID